MPLLSSSIVKHQLATVQQVEEALSRQSAHGGDLLTNLLEVCSLGEERVARALAESSGLEAAPIGELPRPPEHVRRLVPAELAQRYACHPLEESAGTLVLAVSEPLPAEVENDLGFALGVAIVQRVAPLVRVRQAIARDYGIPLEPRFARALARLEGRPDPNPSDRPPPQQPPAERPPTVAPPPAAVAAPEASLRPPSPSRKAELKAFVRAARPEPPKPRRLGPYTAAMAERDLLAAAERDEVLRAFFDFAAQYFEYSALFAVHTDLAEGRDAHGPGAARAKVQSVGIPLDLPSVLATTRDADSHKLVRLGGSGLDQALAKDLERRPGPLVLLLPIRVRGRCVLILYGDHGESDIDLHATGDVISFAPLVSAALERLIVQKKRGRGEPLALGSLAAARRPARAVLPSAEERAEALASVLAARPSSAALERETSSDAPPPVPSSEPPRPQVPSSEPPPPLPSSEPVSPSSAEPAAAATAVESSPPPRADDFDRWTPQPPEPSEPTRLADPSELSAGTSPPSSHPHARPVAPPTTIGAAKTRSSAPPRSIAEALARPVIAVGRRSDRPTDPPLAETTRLEPRRIHSIPPHAVDAGWGELGAGSSPFGAREIRTQPGVGQEPVHERPPPAPAHDSPEVSLATSDADDSPDVSIGSEQVGEELAEIAVQGSWEEPDSPGVPVAATSRVEAHSARPLAARGSSTELRLPSVIVDVSQDCQALLAQLLAGDASASERLVAAGAGAVPVLVAAFPGPIELPATRRAGSALPRASECGPVLRTLAKLGVQAAPFLVVRTNDANPDVRSWATRLLGEIPSPESAHAVARRFFDGDVDVRRSALAAARLLASSPDTSLSLVTELGLTAEDRGKPTGVRLTAMEMLAELRHPHGVPYLVLALSDNPIDIVQAARRALVVLARQDFGTVPHAWTEWWRTAQHRHRIEWLIDSLTHELPEIRRAAGEELKALSREYFGYYDDLPPAGRVQAQAKYREWWDTLGKARFRA